MLTPEENELLARVEGDAPMGQIFRRHWLPALLIGGDPRSRLRSGPRAAARREPRRVPRYRRQGRPDPGGLPASRRVAVLWPQRGMRPALPLSRLEVRRRRQLRRDGVGAGRIELLRQGQDQVLSGGRVRPASCGPTWGRAETMPEFEPPVFQPTPETHVVTTKVIVEANWAQMLEGSIDSAHSSTLHSSDMVPARVPGAQSTVTQWQRPSTDKAPRLVVQRTSYGFRYAAIRRPIKDAATHDYVRTTLFVAPYLVHIPPNNLHRSCTVHVPRDDNSTTFYFVAFGGDTVPAQEDWRKLHANRVGFDLDATYRNSRNRGEQLPPGPQGDEARQFHRHPRHHQPGHRDVGIDGADRRSHPRPARRLRPRHRGVPQADGGGRPHCRRRRARDRHDRAAHAARQAAARSRASCRRRPTGARSAPRPRRSRSPPSRKRRKGKQHAAE